MNLNKLVKKSEMVSNRLVMNSNKPVKKSEMVSKKLAMKSEMVLNRLVMNSMKVIEEEETAKQVPIQIIITDPILITVEDNNTLSNWIAE